MKKRSVPAFVLFLYDCARLGFILAIVKEQGNIPLLTANALFPIVSFFLFDNSRKYREYVPLYAAGKAVGVFAGIVWLFVTLKNGVPLSVSPDGGTDYTVLLLGVLGILVVTDTLSVLARLLMRKRELLQSQEPFQSQESSHPIEPFESAGDIANCE
ncbi:MAG: hypothetical protein LBK61_12565 [Spirochaetaceae bacterium]|nr:hypothetical protein [Spirochaetaceae bacterium]